MSVVGTRIKQRREEAKMSLSELARLASISKGYLHTIESGETQSPSADVLFRIANVFDTTIADLMGEEQLSSVNDSLENKDIPSALLRFAKEAKLPETDIQMLARISFRGKQPQDPEDWRYIYESIKRSIR
jgi:transcriptional regulator with XRE-family HTH domain